ncbi:hypothetical protein Sjap_020223 [Stephania japonica]|uniref:SBP-type domain-containing protein n=1 Tax=Stephania japonica TaxID=461633 RepID=A0AAP0F987_9MAGN
MLEYHWADNNPPMLLSVDEPSAHQNHDQCDQTRQVFDDHHTNPSALPNTFSHTAYPFQLQDNYTTSLSYPQPHRPFPPPSALTLEPIPSGPNFIFITKDNHTMDYSSTRIGLNLGGRTYFSSSENDFLNELDTSAAAAANAPRCQAQGCNADLTHAKHYHRRHKVCEFHSKAATALIAGLTQRFCQQCSRFHLLAEFDQGKRSCRKRLADHNRRRRKSQPQQQQNHELHQIDNTDGSPSAISMSSPDSSSMTVGVSPTRIMTSFGSFGSLATPDSTASAAASSCTSSFSRW